MAGLVAAAPSADAGAALVLVCVAAAASLAGTAVALRPPALGTPALTAIAALTTALITASMAFGGVRESMADAEMLYLLVVLYAAWFLGSGHAAGHLGLAALAYGSLFAIRSEPPPTLSRWLVTVATLAVATVVFGHLRRHHDRLIGQLADSARRDPLTGLFNRRGFEEQVVTDLARLPRAEAPLSLLLADLDRFKEVNDRLGHAAGDDALRRVAVVLTTQVRPGDIIARYGGEEFALALPDCTEKAALDVAERLRELVTEAFAPDPVPLTISIGVAVTERPQRLATLLEQADAALYRAKGAGRDRVVAG